MLRVLRQLRSTPRANRSLGRRHRYPAAPDIQTRSAPGTCGRRPLQLSRHRSGSRRRAGCSLVRRLPFRTGARGLPGSGLRPNGESPPTISAKNRASPRPARIRREGSEGLFVSARRAGSAARACSDGVGDAGVEDGEVQQPLRVDLQESLECARLIGGDPGRGQRTAHKYPRALANHRRDIVVSSERPPSSAINSLVESARSFRESMSVPSRSKTMRWMGDRCGVVTCAVRCVLVRPSPTLQVGCRVRLSGGR